MSGSGDSTFTALNKLALLTQKLAREIVMFGSCWCGTKSFLKPDKSDPYAGPESFVRALAATGFGVKGARRICDTINMRL